MSKFFTKSVNKLLSSDRKASQTATTNATAILEQECEKREALKLFKTLRYGFPHDPTSMAYDPVQHLLAIGTRNGCVKIYGGPFIESTITSPTQSAVLFMSFVINEGVLLTYCEDSTLSFWTLRQKQPVASFSRKLICEKATVMHLPFQNKWLYIGTEKGNIYVLNVYNNFTQSGYDIKWNNIIELSQKTHPGRIVHLSDHPLDNSKMLIGFDYGLIVLWNVKHKKAEARFNANLENSNLISISWFFDGKQFMSSYDNGYIAMWNLKQEFKPVQVLRPNYDETDLVKSYNKIDKVSWEATKNGDSMYIFSNGLSEQCSMRDAISIVRHKTNKHIIEMKEKIIDFLVVHPTPYQTDEPNDAIAVIVLLENNLVTIDLKTDGYPLFEHHHSINLHESPISYYEYIVEPDLKLLQHILVSKELQSKCQTNSVAELPAVSLLPYPITGGIKGCKNNMFPYSELILTGHEDGTVKLWEASGICLDFVYELKTNKIFNKVKIDNQIEIDYPFKVSSVCINADYFVVAAYGGHVTLYKYINKKLNPADEELGDIPQLEIQHNYESNDKSQNDVFSLSTGIDQTQRKDLKSSLKVKIGYKRQQGYQPELVCLFLWSQKPPVVNNLAIDTSHSILVVGTDESVICIDYQSRTLLINVQVSEYFNVNDIVATTQRIPKSPKKSKTIANDSYTGDDNLSESSNALQYFSKQLTFDNSHLQRTMDATFGESSRSPSSCSTEIIPSEMCSCIVFNELMVAPTKTDFTTLTITNLWIGTTYGSVIVLSVNSQIADLNANLNSNANIDGLNCSTPNPKQIILTPNGSKYSLKGQILNISFLDSNGYLINHNVNTANSPSAVSTDSPCNLSHTLSASADDSKLSRKKQPLVNTRSVKMESSFTIDIPDRHQYAVLCSEGEARVILLPAQTCLYKHTFDDDAIITKATVASINNQSYLLCYSASGNVHVLNLPTLKLNALLSLSLGELDKDDLQRIGKEFVFGSKGHAFYMCTPSEIQKLVLTSSLTHNLSEVLPELFDPKVTMPVAPKPSLLKSIFNTSTPLDRELLFGETSGKPSISIVRNTVEAEANRARGELNELQKAALLRGEKLSALEKRAEEMTNSAMNYSKNAHELANKYKKKSQWF